ncbi:MAG TPA: RNA 2',3'-cyclic phosphodiesterase [Terracidiphilus sp.]|nr:RNA 2',3'-cyclic phosphodiesterase [Terracidiphilus sp.]
MRLFVAIPVGAGTRQELEQLVARLRRPDDHLKWTAPAGWHITLAFLGNSTADQLGRLNEQLAAVHFAPFPINFAAPEIFDRAGAFVVSVQPTAELAALQRAVSAVVAACGFVSEARAFHPHLTLARARRGARLRVDATAKVTGFMAWEFSLYESFLEIGGARHEVRQRFELNS